MKIWKKFVCKRCGSKYLGAVKPTTIKLKKWCQICEKKTVMRAIS